MKMVEAFKNSKKEMEIKFDQAKKIVDSASDEFIESIKSLAKSASEKELEEFLNCNDEAIDFEDKLAIIAAFAEHHDDIDGMAIIGIHHSNLS